MNDPDGILPDQKAIAAMIQEAKKVIAKCEQQRADMRKLRARLPKQRIKMQALSKQLQAEHPLDRIWIGWRVNGKKGS